MKILISIKSKLFFLRFEYTKIEITKNRLFCKDYLHVYKKQTRDHERCKNSVDWLILTTMIATVEYIEAKYLHQY